MNDFQASVKKASLSLKSDSKKLLIKSEFYFWNRGNTGMIFIGSLGVAAIVFTILKVKDVIPMIFVIILGLALLTAAFLGIFKQVSDFVEVSDRKIKFSNSLKRREFLIKYDFKIKVKSSTEKVKRRNRTASYFRIVEVYLKTGNDKFRILDFQMDEKDSIEADELGKEIKKMIKERLTEV